LMVIMNQAGFALIYRYAYFNHWDCCQKHNYRIQHHTITSSNSSLSNSLSFNIVGATNGRPRAADRRPYIPNGRSFTKFKFIGAFILPPISLEISAMMGARIVPYREQVDLACFYLTKK